MGGQNIERRQILRFIALASVAGTYPGFSKWCFACVPDHVTSTISRSAQTKLEPFKPLFFPPPKYRMLEHLTEMIIPADDTPGAKEAGVAEFIDFMVANRVPITANRDVRSTDDALELGNEAQNRFLSGLDWMNARCKSEFGRGFMDCLPEQQQSFLEELAYKAKFKPTNESGREFFRLLRDYTVVGYYTTRIGLESLGYPGLRVVWPSMPGCNHPNDPEHIHLHEQADSPAAAPSNAGQKGAVCARREI